MTIHSFVVLRSHTMTSHPSAILINVNATPGVSDTVLRFVCTGTLGFESLAMLFQSRLSLGTDSTVVCSNICRCPRVTSRCNSSMGRLGTGAVSTRGANRC